MLLFRHFLLLILSPLLALAIGDNDDLPSTCFIGKICAGGFMQQYTIYEDYPDLTVGRSYRARIFEVSQTVGEIDDGGHEADPQKPIVAPAPHSRVYTVTTTTFTGLGGNGCTLDFNNPCNSSVQFYHHGNATIAVRPLPYFPSPPTWNNVIPLIEPVVLGTYGGEGDKPWERNSFQHFTGDVCGYINKSRCDWDTQTFVYSIDEGVKETASVTWTQTLMNSNIWVGISVNYTC